MGYLTKVTLDGTDITPYVLQYEVNRSIDTEFDNADVTLAGDVTTAIATFKVGDEVVISRGAVTSTDDVVFRGVLAKISKQSPQIKIECFDKLWTLTKQEATRSWDRNNDPEAGNISKIAFTLITEIGGLDATFGGTIQDSGTTVTLDKFISNHDKIYDRVQVLTRVLGWQLYYNPSNDKGYLEPLGSTTYNGGTLMVGDGGNIVNNPKWTYDYSRMVNRINVVGAETIVETTQKFDGDGTTSQFNLNFVPRSVKVYVGGDINNRGVLQVGGVEDSTIGTFDYKVDDTNEVRSVFFESLSIPSTGTKNVWIDYSYPVPTPVQTSNDESIDAYGVFEDTQMLIEVKTVQDAEQYAQEIIRKFSLPFVNTRLEVTGVFGLFPGYVIDVVDEINNENRQVVVRSQKILYPAESDVLRVGDEQWRLDEWMNGLNARVARQEREASKNTGKLTIIKDLEADHYADNRYFKLLRNEIGDSAILDHPVNGLSGDSGGLIGGGSGWTCGILVRLVHPDDTYIEDFIDTDFKDADTTTANWDTTNRRVSFA